MLCTKIKIFQFSIFFIILSFFSCFNGIALSAEYYVSPSGSSSWSQCTNISSPCSATTAMTNAKAGDTVYFRGGTYQLGQSDNNQKGSGVLYPSNSGTSDTNRIVFSAYPNEVPVLNTTVNGNIISRAWGDMGHHYTTLKGFTISSTGATYSGSVGIGNGSIGTVIDSCLFLGSSTPGTNTDNISGLAFEYATYTVIKNCKFVDYRDANNNHNTSAIKTYGTDYLTVTNCEFKNCTVGMYDKVDNQYNTFKNNFFKDCYIGLFVTMNSASSNNSSVFNNLFVNMTYYAMGLDTSSVRGVNWSFYNNTVYNSSPRNITLGYSSGTKVYNNLLVGSASEGQLRVHTGGSVKESDHNLYSGTFNVRYNNGTYSSLAAWQGSSALEGGGKPGTGSLHSNPVFVNTSGNLNQVGDFKLASASPGKGAGRNGQDMGADISLVGVLSGGAPPPPPPPDPQITTPSGFQTQGAN